MHDEVTIIIWTKCDVDINVPVRVLKFDRVFIIRRWITVWEHTVTSTLKTTLMSDDFPDWRCLCNLEPYRRLPKSSWTHLPHNEKSEPMGNTWTIYMSCEQNSVEENALEVFRNHFPHFRIEWPAGETIHCISFGSSPWVLLSLSVKVHEPYNHRTHLRSFAYDPDWGS